MKTWPTTNGWAYIWSSTVSVNTLPNCCTLTLLVVNAVSLSFQPDLVLSLCCVSTETDWGLVVLGFVGVSVHVASNRRASGSGSWRLITNEFGSARFPCFVSSRPPAGERPQLAAGRYD